MLNRLEEHGFLQKVKSDSDRRSAHVHLTEKGDKASHLHVDVHKRFAKLLTQQLTDSEKEILVVLLNKAIKSI
jgi:DNA-binding MarR family transcriptional regulator